MKTVKKVGFHLLTQIFGNRQQCRDGASMTNTVKVHDVRFPWFNTTVPGFGTTYYDEKCQEWKLQDHYYIWSTMGGLMMLGSSGPTFYPKYAICHAVSERFSRTEDFFHLSMPTHIIHVAYAERLGENSAVVQRNFVIDIYWLTPEERDCIQEVYFYQKSEWKKK